MSEQFLSEVELAARWVMSSKTLTRWRCDRRGPPYVKLGKTVRYAMSDVLEFEKNGLCKPVSRQVTPDEPSTPDIIQNMTVRDVVAGLHAAGGWHPHTVEIKSKPFNCGRRIDSQTRNRTHIPRCSNVRVVAVQVVAHNVISLMM